MYNLGEKGEFPTPPKLCPPKLLRIYLVIDIIYTGVNFGSQHDIESSTCHRRSTVTTEVQAHRGISNQNGLHCEVCKTAQCNMQIGMKG